MMSRSTLLRLKSSRSDEILLLFSPMASIVKLSWPNHLCTSIYQFCADQCPRVNEEGREHTLQATCVRIWQICSCASTFGWLWVLTFTRELGAMIIAFLTIGDPSVP